MKFISIAYVKKDVTTVLNTISSVTPSKVYGVKAGRGARARISPGSGNYDSVTLSSPRQDNQFMGLVSKLSQEVRTATTTGDIAALRQQVADHTYTPDPRSIAARILLLGEGA